MNESNKIVTIKNQEILINMENVPIDRENREIIDDIHVVINLKYPTTPIGHTSKSIHVSINSIESFSEESQ
ncbi:hypothetical protein MGH68_07130 [Erysipelothrix sp. D19-032]